MRTRTRTILISLCLSGMLSAVFCAEAEPLMDEGKVIKTFIDRMKTALEVDIDSFPALIAEVETYTQTVAELPSRAMLHSMAAEMYHRYYQQNRWTIDRRTPLEGFVPDDIREWTSNLFAQKIKEALAASLLPAETLRQTPASRFSEVLEAGQDSPSLRPTLYDFLVHRAIEIQPSDAFYEDWLAFRRSQPDDGRAALLVELDYLQYRHASLPQDKQDVYEAALDSLLNVYAGEEYVVEIAHAKLKRLQRKRYRAASPDSVLAVEYRLCQDILARFPGYKRIGIIRNWLDEMEEQRVAVESRQTVYPGKNLELRLRYTNLAKVSVSLYQSGKKTETIAFTLPLRNAYTSHDTTLSVPMGKPGLYTYEVSAPGSKLRVANEVSVSRLAAVVRTTPSGETELLVTDYLSGRPLSEATVNYYGVNRRTPQLLGAVQTDANGLARIPSTENVYACRPWLPGDEASPIVSIYAGGYPADEHVRTEVRLLTDRGVYRPGQTLFFKGIAYLNDPEHPQVAPGERLEVVLHDANDKEVATQSFTTNAFGSFSGSFSLPRQTLTGTFTLSTQHTSVSLQVEEYKRPTFHVELPPVAEEVAFGDEVSIRGKAQTFSGAVLTAGEVVYRVMRRPFFLRTYYGYMREELVAEGQTSVGSDGTFAFVFRPEQSPELSRPAFQTYEIIATLTDSKGETQEARTLFSAGERSIVLSSNLPAKVDKDTTTVEIAAHTLNGNPLTTQGAYTFHLLEETAKEGEYTEGQKLSEGTFATGKPLSQGVLSRLPSGRIRLHLSAVDTQGRRVEEQQDFVLYSRSDKRPPVRSHTWLLTDRSECLPGEEAEICFGTSDREVYLLYELFSQGTNVARRRVVLSDENRAFRLPFLESYGEGVIASFTFVKEGQLHTEQTTLLRKRPDRRLAIKPETFRDKSLPGSRESWTFRVSDAQSLPAIAEVAAGMYDASLDNIHPFAWSFAPQSYAQPYYRPFREGEGLRPVYGSDAVERKERPTPPFAFDRLNWQGALDFPVMEGLLTRNKTLMMAVAPPPPSVQEYLVEVADEAGVRPAAGRPETSPPSPTPQLRTNFNETAFFFPSLLTDKEGRVVVNFTLPESQTTWKLQTLAHTADLKYGLSTHQLITQKPLMVLPNLPRFLRQGDQASLSAQIINLSEEAASGQARLELFDPANDQAIGTANTLPFALAPGGTTTLRWPVGLPESIGGLVGCRIIAESEAGSDGEQHLLPVLPDEILVTESIPFYLTDEKEKRVEIAEASPARRMQSMTVELSSNPVWYAVQALPALAQPRNDDAVSWFNAYYSQTLAASVARSNPHIKSVIDQWEAQKETPSTLRSNLEQNEELKNILLEETPWVLEAQTETEQKQRLSLLFDVNRIAYQRETAMQELLRQQHEEGGWGWFKGFYPNRSITLYILDGMAKLSQLNAATYTPQEKAMQTKALHYLDKTFLRDYEHIRRSKASLLSYRPASESLLYIYVRSAYRDVPVANGAEAAIRYYTEQAEKQWSKASLYEKGLIALLMHRNGREKTAREILAWLRKTATTSAEQGMYWANNRRENNFFVSPTDVHSLLMTLFRTLGTDEGETDRMKQWLLNRKRTQNWEPSPSTANALYSLLAEGSNWLAETNSATLQWGDRTLHTAAGETATGYLRETVSGQDLTPALHSLTLRKEGKTPAWGALYYQYTEAIAKVDKQGGALSVEKRIISPEGVDKPLKVGDQVVVRLTIRTDRDMEYVSLKDMRPGCFEPAVQRSGLRTVDGLVCYHAPKDASENFFFDRLPRGTYVLEYTAYVSRSGQYSSGIATLQCLYAPEFAAHTEGNLFFVTQ